MLLNAFFNRLSTWSIAATFVLIWSFVGSRMGALLQMFSPIAVAPVRRKMQLRGSEVLIGVIVAVFLSSEFAVRAVGRRGPLGGFPSLPDYHIVGAIAFWGTFAYLSWRIDWHRAWRWIASATFTCFAPFSIFSAAYTSIDWPSDIVASLFLGFAILCVAFWAATIHVRPSEG